MKASQKASHKISKKGIHKRIQKDIQKDSILFEVELLTALNEIGLSVPQIKSEVFEFNYEGIAYSGVLMEELKGKSLQWLGVKDLNTADITCQLAIKSIKTLHSLTPDILSIRFQGLSQ